MNDRPPYLCTRLLFFLPWYFLFPFFGSTSTNYPIQLEYMYGARNNNSEVARAARDNKRQIGARNASAGMFFLALLSGYFQLDYVLIPICSCDIEAAV